MDSTDYKHWLEFAENDFKSANHLLSMYPVPIEIICYHCQQAGEKALKGFLVYKNSPYPKTHDLLLLNDLCKPFDDSFKILNDACDRLSAYGVVVRYPDEIDVNESDMKKALADAQGVLDFVKGKIQ